MISRDFYVRFVGLIRVPSCFVTTALTTGGIIFVLNDFKGTSWSPVTTHALTTGITSSGVVQTSSPIIIVSGKNSDDEQSSEEFLIPKEKSNKILGIAIGVSIFAIVLIGTAIACLLFKRCSDKDKTKKMQPPIFNNPFGNMLLKYSELNKGEKIGSGQYGDVYK